MAGNRKKSRKPLKKRGLAPGTLVFTGEQKTEEAIISMMDYSKAHVTERKLGSIRDVCDIAKSDSITWINIDGIHDLDLIRSIGEHFHIHPLVQEDIVNPHQRPKVEVYPDYIYVVMKMVNWNEEHTRLEFEQLSVIFTRNYVFTIQERPGDSFDGVRERIRNASTRIRNSGIDFLFYALVDSIVDEYFNVLEELGERIQGMEDSLMENANNQVLFEIQNLKRDIILFRKYTWPARDVVNQLQRSENPVFTAETKVFLHDVYDHILRIIETVESYRDLTSGVQELYLSIVNNRMNEIMKVLALISTIFLPMTLVSSIYGMNFHQNFPELDWTWGYPFALGLMLLIGLGMLWFFKKRKWI